MSLRYFRPKSVTWWAGVASIMLGSAQLMGLDSPYYGELGSALISLLGGFDSSPAGLILFGLGLVGIRDKLERLFE